MSNTEVTLFNNGAGLPAYLADIGGEEGNIAGRETIPQLSYRGKVWRVVIDGVETICLKDDGEPLQTIPVVVLEYNKKRSRAFFEGGYEEGKTSKPSCWSRDGVTPDANVPTPQSPACASCPQSIKGSKITEAGKETTACSQFRNAVVAAPTLAAAGWTPLLLKMAQTSLWDKEAAEYEAKGFYAFDTYMETLLRKGVTHTARVVTKIKFDPRVAYPKLFFGPADWLPAEAAGNVKALLDDKAAIAKLLSLDMTTEVLGVETAKPNGAHSQTPPPPVAANAPAKAELAKAKAPPKPPAPKPNPLAAASDDDDSVSLMPPPAAKPTPAAVAKAKATAVDATPVAKVPADAPKGAGLSTLLTAWDDE